MSVQGNPASRLSAAGPFRASAWKTPAPEFLDELPLAIYACDAYGKILWFNARAAALWGRSPRVGDDDDLLRRPMDTVLRTGIPLQGLECEVERPDGSRIAVIATIGPVLDEDGEIQGAINCFRERPATDQEPARRTEEQAALFTFSERLQHCSSTEQIHEAALDAITRALNCRRASILLYDSGAAMRFVAWRELSSSYRNAVEGHSPWTPEESDPQPVCMEDVAASDLSQELKQRIAGEGIGAALFIPIMREKRLVGKFMAYHDRPHRFTDFEIDVALTVARLLGFGLARLADEEERQLAERDARQLAAIVESSDDAIVSKDLNGIIQTWNAGAERMFGYRRNEAIGQPITMLIPADRQDEETRILSQIRAGRRVQHFETVRQRKDGSLLDISLTISPICDRSGRIIGASKIARDITERKLAEQRLQDSERRLQELLAAIPAAIYTTDAEGRITYFNEAAVELAGRTPLLGSDEWCVTWKLYNPDGTPLPHDQCPMAVALKEGRAVRGAEAVAERPDGTRVPFIPFPTPLRDSSGQVVGAINMLVDISERKQAESQQRLLLNELNHRTKNNMQVLQSLLANAARSARSDEARRVLSEASGRIAAMAAAQRVLYGTADASSFSASKFLQAVVATVEQTLPPDVRIESSEASGILSNDAAMPLALIVNELLTNAAKHGIKDPSRDSIRIGLAERDGQFELHVEDDGPGFDIETVRQASSGLRLVLGLSRQLRGTFEVTRSPSRASLRFASGNHA